MNTRMEEIAADIDELMKGEDFGTPKREPPQREELEKYAIQNFDTNGKVEDFLREYHTCLVDMYWDDVEEEGSGTTFRELKKFTDENFQYLDTPLHSDMDEDTPKS